MSKPAAVARPVRALIVDDEPLARAHLRSLLAEDPEVVVVGECGNGRDAVAAIRRDPPDLVFLDIQMPELDGFGVVSELGLDALPVIVFVTAYDEYALKAFDAHALDYLVKPLNRERFRAAVDRAKRQVAREGRPADEPLARLLEQLGAKRGSPDRIALKAEGRVIFLRVDTIDWIEATGDHVRFHVGPHSHVQRDTLTRLERRLPEGKFLRVHRSAIVNVDKVREMQPWFQGDYVLVLTDGTKVTTGRSYRERIRALLERAQ